jgi:hypothetical protein
MKNVILRGLSALTIVLCLGGCGASALATTSAAYRQGPAIAHAVRQTLADYIRRDVTAFCADFTRPVAAHLISAESTCEAGLAPTFAPHPGQEEIYTPSERPNGLRITHARWRDLTAHLTSTWPWPNIRMTVKLTLQKVHGRWLIATPTHVVEERLCNHVFGKLTCRTFYGVRFGAHVPPVTVTVEPIPPRRDFIERAGLASS